ncbi:MAG: hypothetical protein MdMp024_1034 [Bacteroidales bacterium]
MYRFRKEENSYPLYQLGPGLLSINTVDSVYIWEHFEEEIQRILSVFKDSYDFDNNTRLNVALKYIDFYPFDFNENLRLFLSDNLHLEIKDNIQIDNNPNLLTFSTGYNTENGQFNYSINRANVNQKGDGLLVETNLSKKVLTEDFDKISSWLNIAHDFFSEIFKTKTAGKMYDSFSN